MKKRILQRVLLGVITLWLVSVLIFIGTEMLPGDVATAILGQSATPETQSSRRASSVDPSFLCKPGGTRNLPLH